MRMSFLLRYVYYIPEGEWPNHFSSLFLSADTLSTLIEVLNIYSLDNIYPILFLSADTLSTMIEVLNIYSPAHILSHEINYNNSGSKCRLS